MAITRTGICALAALAVVVPGSRDAKAQKPGAVVQAPEIARTLRTEGHAGLALNMLTQARGPQPHAVQDEIADSLVAIAVGFPGYDRHGVVVRGTAATTLYLAALGHTNMPTAPRGIPYAGAAERLRRISEFSHDIGVRSTALQRFSDLTANAGALPYLRALAVSQSEIAYRAIEILARGRGVEGRAILRELHRTDAVKGKRALFALQGYAAEFGWVKYK